MDMNGQGNAKEENREEWKSGKIVIRQKNVEDDHSACENDDCKNDQKYDEFFQMGREDDHIVDFII
jgi:hypothetical protein